MVYFFAVDYEQTAMFTMIYDGVAAAAAVEPVHPRAVNNDASTSEHSRYDLTDPHTTVAALGMLIRCVSLILINAMLFFYTATRRCDRRVCRCNGLGDQLH